VVVYGPLNVIPERGLRVAKIIQAVGQRLAVGKSVRKALGPGELADQPAYPLPAVLPLDNEQEVGQIARIPASSLERLN